MSEIWYFNASPKALGKQGTSYSVNFTSGGQSFTILRNGTVFKEKFYLYYNDTEAYKSGWKSPAFRTIEFAEPVSGALLTYMEANATKMDVPLYAFKAVMRGSERIGTGTYKFAPYVDYAPSTDFTVTVNATNMTYTPSAIPNMTAESTQEIVFTANDGYKVPQQSDIAVANATITSFTRTSDSVCKVTIGGATGNVTVTAVATRIPTYSVTFHLTNISYPSSVYMKEGEEKSIGLTASTGYIMPDSMSAFTVTNATIKTYSLTADRTYATMVLKDATGNITVTGSALQSQTISGVYRLQSVLDLSKQVGENVNFLSNGKSCSGIVNDGSTLAYNSNLDTTTYDAYYSSTGWVDTEYRVLDFGSSAQTVTADLMSFLNTNKIAEDANMIQIAYVGKTVDTSSLPYNTSYTIRSSAPTIVSVQDDGGVWVAEALAQGDAVITVIETIPEGDVVRGSLTVAVAPALTGTALPKDVRVTKTFFNTDPNTKETGTIPTYANAHSPMLAVPQNESITATTLSFDSVEGATSYNIYANSTLLGTVSST